MFEHPQAPVSRGSGHFRRFHGYDYSRGAVLFITFGVARRLPVFGSIGPAGELFPSPAGLAAREVIETEARKDNGIQLKALVVMPDHIHLRIYLKPNLDRPLVQVGDFVRNIKRWILWRSKLVGVAFDWEEGYHDRLCLGREVIELVDKYIANNPLKWYLMHGIPPPLKVFEPLDLPRFPPDEWWSAVGETALLDEGRRLCAIRLSRKIPAALYGEVTARLVRAVTEKGFTLAGTFISPCERAVAAALQGRGLPLIRAIPDKLAMVYRPKGDEPAAFAAGRLLLLSRVYGGESRYDA